MTKRKMTDVERGGGAFMGFVTNLATCLRERDLPFEVLHRLATDAGRETIERMLDVARTDWSAQTSGRSTTQSFPPNHYRIRVDRGELPSLPEGQKWFPDYSGLLYPSLRWKRHPSRCFPNDITSQEVVVLAQSFGEFAVDNELAMDWGFQRGYVPADPNEAFAFATDPQTHDLVRERPYVALGAVFQGETKQVAVLRMKQGRKSFQTCGIASLPHGSGVLYILRPQSSHT